MRLNLVRCASWRCVTRRRSLRPPRLTLSSGYRFTEPGDVLASITISQETIGSCRNVRM